MKTKILTLIALGCFVSAACKKDDTTQNTKEETIEIKGKLYTIDYLRSEMARNLQVSVDSLIYNKEDTTFTIRPYLDGRISALRLFN
ncbi:hypothetical protein [Sphingobacterium sp. SGR-19]|uniref:hypothetical protein n=1 Tax=Sphingobacterium sp. SGR-19 TaxID=2710886 RepID=UPI0013EC715C|nr:hypothetical protein [Sphingobacterium sp. SGR-19]NGM67303.1 hypothetical protein [Sphingobacterium sp. SGR-19]